jgi:multicomponent K+:H+ antiporter subunit A
MYEPLLILPLIILLFASALALIYGIPAIRERVTVVKISWFLALAPLTGFISYFIAATRIPVDAGLHLQIPWISSLDISFSLYFDQWSALFGLMVSGIGTLIIIYTGYYFKGDKTAWRFLTFMMLFMLSMLGIVTAGDLITLFIFWEGTSITSYLLIGHKYKDPDAQRGAFKALFITGGGGIALLAGLLFLGSISGTYQIAEILRSGDLIRSHVYYPAMFTLIAIGALTKSAQFPAHIWLPQAMTAPTPASAFLHSATMVKAGIFLLGRLNPALGYTDLWFWVLSLAGLFTMLIGAYLGLKQNDLKALLAYSTISQLGVLVMLIGQDTEIAFKALVIGVLAHALYKSALFLIAGIVDHETGTRDIRRLGGLRKIMPITFVIGTISALSMAGLPPLFGFLAKETLLATIAHPSIPPIIDIIFPIAAVIAGALLLAQSGLLIRETFLGKPKDPEIHGHEPPRLMLLAPFIPATISLAIGILPEPEFLARFLANAAGAVYGAPVKVSLALWTGINVPLLLSIIAISIGSIIFVFRHPVRRIQGRLGSNIDWNTAYDAAIKLIDRSAYWATRLQYGKLRTYLSIIMGSMVILVVGLSVVIYRVSGLDIQQLDLSIPPLELTSLPAILKIFPLLLSAGAALATVLLRRDLFAIIALGAMGLSVAIIMVLEPAPDVALVQIVVDILAVVILILALTRIPRQQRAQAWEFTFKQSQLGLIRDGVISTLSGGMVAFLTFVALTTRPRESIATPFYEANAQILTGAKDIVGAIIVDFRAIDTLIEIAVFSMAGLGIYTLLRYAAKKVGDTSEQLSERPMPASKLPGTFGIGGDRTSSFIHALAYLLLPIALITSVTHIMYGHDQPGDGFTAGVILGLVIGLWYVVFGYEETRRRLAWFKGGPLVATGILLAITNAMLAAWINGTFLSNVNYGELIGLQLPAGFYFSTSFIFELSICLSVLGGTAYIMNTLGHPGQIDLESAATLEEIRKLEQAEEAKSTSDQDKQPSRISEV